jgi:hypothetical protein
MRSAIQSVRYVGTFPRERSERWRMIGQDGGQSIAVGDRVLFVFSDTLLAIQASKLERAPVPRAFAQLAGTHAAFLANCAGMTTGGRISDAWANIRYFMDPDGFPREILRPLGREQAQRIRFWPEHGIFLDGHVWLYYLGIQQHEPASIWGFRTLGTGLARLDPETGSCERLWFGDDWRVWPSVNDDTHFGVQVVQDGEYVYIFGSVRAGLYCTARLARVRCADIGSPEKYEYLTSGEPSWGASLQEALDLGPSGTDFSVSRNDHLGCYTMFYVDSYYKRLMFRSAPELWGPYSEPEVIIGVPHAKGTELVYLGFEHPDFRKDGGRSVFISYCQPRFTSNALVTLRFR